MRARARPSSQASHTNALVSSITSILQTLIPQNPDLTGPNSSLSHLDQFSQILNPNLVIQVIKSQSNPNLALFFFRWASNPNPNPKKYSHNKKCYSAMLDLLISHNMLSTAVNFLETTNNLSDFMISKLIKAHGNLGQIRVAIQWLNRAKRLESGRCLCSYNAVLEVLVRGYRIKLARALFDQIVIEGIVKPNVLTYTVMIRGFCKMGMVENAKKMFDGMICKPNLVTYNVIIDGLCKKGLMDDAKEVLDKMVAGKDCLPDTVTFTTMIDGYCKKNDLEEASRCMEEMVKNNCDPNVVTYNALINGFCLNGKIEEAKKIMTKMKLRGLKENVATHRSLLKGMCIVGRPDDAAKHLKEMAGLGLKPDIKAYGVVFNEFCKLRRPAEATMILDEMRVRDMNPSVSSFNALIMVLCDMGELDKAILVLKEMPWNCSPNFFSYGIVISSLCRVRGRMRDVEELVVGLVQRGYLLDTSIYSLMVEGYCEDGDLEMAIGVFHTMVGKGLMIKLHSFSVFVKELCGKGKVSEVNKAFEEICRICHIFNVVECYRRIIEEHQCNVQPDLQTTGTPIFANQKG